MFELIIEWNTGEVETYPVRAATWAQAQEWAEELSHGMQRIEGISVTPVE